jgi:hypothetical protein
LVGGKEGGVDFVAEIKSFVDNQNVMDAVIRNPASRSSANRNVLVFVVGERINRCSATIFTDENRVSASDTSVGVTVKFTAGGSDGLLGSATCDDSDGRQSFAGFLARGTTERFGRRRGVTFAGDGRCCRRDWTSADGGLTKNITLRFRL